MAAFALMLRGNGLFVVLVAAGAAAVGVVAALAPCFRGFFTVIREVAGVAVAAGGLAVALAVAALAAGLAGEAAFFVAAGVGVALVFALSRHGFSLSIFKEDGVGFGLSSSGGSLRRWACKFHSGACGDLGREV